MASITKLSIFLISAPVLLLLVAPASSTSYTNVLTSGNRLAAGASLVHNNFSFVMQDDCNLVLYNGADALWSSNTEGAGKNCSLVLQHDGELFINTASHVTVWRSETGGSFGRYAFVLLPNGDGVVYGSPVWSTGTYSKQT